MKSYQISFLVIIWLCSGGCSTQKQASPENYQNTIATNSPRSANEPDSPSVNNSQNINQPSASNSDNKNEETDKLDENIAKRIKYSQLNDSEKIEFIQTRMNHIAYLIANEKYYFNTGDEKKALQIIKYWIDTLQKRVGNRQGSNLWGGDLNLLFNRGRNYAPIIIQAAKKRSVPKVVPLYIAAIETEFTNVQTQNPAGAAGLFQFIPSTARLYKINPSERTNVPLMADIASKYIGDRMKEFGNDTRSVALCIAGYNRNPENVRRDLHAVLEMKNNTEKERSFWTMIEHEESLISRFGERERKNYRENMPYVPRFFAFAIIGETPWAFDINLEQALSTYEK